MAKCSNCGANVKNKSAFCPGCGTKVELPVNVSGKKGISTVLVVVLVVLALAVGVGAGVIMVGMGTEKGASGEVVSGNTEETKVDMVEKDSAVIVDSDTETESDSEEETEPVQQESTEVMEDEPETEEVAVEEPVQEVSYNYVCIGDEVRKKEGLLYEACNDIYNFVMYPELIEGWYEGDDEAARILNYSAVHFTKAQPRDIRIIDSRIDGGELDYIYFNKFDESNVDYGVDGERVEAPSSEECYLEYGNVLAISKDYLMGLEAGIYRYDYCFAGGLPVPRGGNGFIIIHDEEEEVKNYRAEFDMATGFYSTESKNDVLFYMNGATSPIKAIIVDYVILDEDCYDLVYDGYGIVFHPEFLEQYKDRMYLEALVWTESGLKVEIKVAYLNHVE